MASTSPHRARAPGRHAAFSARLLPILLLGAFGAAGAASAQAVRPPAAAHSVDAGTLEQRAKLSSNALLQAQKAFERAGTNERAQRASDVTARAAQRQQMMLELIDADPARALAMAMPETLREKLPPQARALVEQNVDASGRVVGMLIDDIERGVSDHPLFLELDDAKGQRLGLAWPHDAIPEEQMMGLIDQRIRVRGLQVGNRLVVGSRNQIETAMYGGTSSSTTMAMATAPLVSGDQRTLVVLGNFSDKAIGCSVSDVQNRLFGSTASVDKILRESSRDAVTFSGNVVGPFTIPYSGSGTCDYNAWGSAIDKAAKAAGIDMSGYARISYALPSNSNCGFSGIANLGGTPPTRSWILSCSTTGVFAHELGHNLRFHHASTPSSEYGDYSDPMGYVRTVQMNAANRVMAGWLGSGNIVDAASSGTYTVATLAAPDTGAAQVLRLRKADTNEYYYVSLRQSLDLDTNLLSTDKNVVSVHRSTGTLPAKTYSVARLAAGQTFNDAANGISVTAQSIVTGSATIGLQLAGAVCSRSAPSVAVSPASQSGSPGTTLRYGLTITNRDSSACASSSFSVAQALPAGFAGSFSSPSVTLAPGASGSLTWSVSSGTSLADGVYSLKASAAESGGTATTAAASYTVFADSSLPTVGSSLPTVSITWPADGSTIPGKPTSLSASAYDANGIGRVDFLVNGSLVGSATTAPYQVRWNAKKSTGLNTLTVRATDTAGNAAESSVRFTVK
ncbi:MAG: Ig-like domain-containing protein [Burkholderiaceae bacterium]|nr:Ig-like domain-containing protein [Burkholderiaceae bacterium]